MSRHFLTRSMLVLVVGVALAMACAKKAPKEPEETTSAPSEFQEAEVQEEAMVIERVQLMPVYFDFDRSTIRASERESLRFDAGAIMSHGAWGVVTVEGNCDERGSEEYNLALGERRARAVADYLVNFGVDKARLRIVSYGESRPAVVGHDEAAWQENRRVDFAISK